MNIMITISVDVSLWLAYQFQMEHPQKVHVRTQLGVRVRHPCSFSNYRDFLI